MSKDKNRTKLPVDIKNEIENKPEAEIDKALVAKVGSIALEQDGRSNEVNEFKQMLEEHESVNSTVTIFFNCKVCYGEPGSC